MIETLKSLVGKQITLRLKNASRGSWGPYELVAVNDTDPIPVVTVRGSRDYVIAIEQIVVAHEGAKPSYEEKQQRKYGVPVPGMEGVEVEDVEDNGNPLGDDDSDEE